MTRDLAAAIVGLAVIVATYAVTRHPMRVIDGDTVAVGATHYRLIGFDTPELSHPLCAAEFYLAQKARDRLVELTAGDFSLEPVPCSCRPSTERTMHCNYGRSCAILRVDGRDVGDILISEGLAKPYNYRWYNPPPKPQWCPK